MKQFNMLCRAALLGLAVFAAPLALAADKIWIDVRSAEEFQAGHLKDALNIPHTEIAAKISAVTQDKNAEIQLYCRSGRRSGLAEAELKKLGFTNVHNAGGYEALKAAAEKAENRIK
ncbi:rhodanese-like domain-containing protein [Rheinheimera texasensis]|uniref:rhodanese-like domain-containing protein n=1 Tax=Rheinheimera texasensis TaxID=306205 RepID=UPI000A066DB3|nr:rhodanese-like domain-containing protein [Rheinheimera texasensis]